MNVINDVLQFVKLHANMTLDLLLYFWVNSKICIRVCYIQMSAYGHLSEPADEGVGMSQEYRGEQGRFLPPRTPHRPPGGNYTRSLSSQL